MKSTILATLLPLVVIAVPLRNSQSWQERETSAKADIRRASDCWNKSLLAGPSSRCVQLLEQASSEYSQMASLLGDSGSPDDVFTVANPFVNSSEPRKAIELLMKSPDRSKNPKLAHLLADTLFALGDYKNAALANEVWIDTGCGGYLYSAQDTVPWVVKKNVDSCKQLPEAVRNRLEMLQDVAGGKPANLPNENCAPGRLTVH